MRRLETLGQMRQMEKNRLDVSAPTVRPSIEVVLAVLDQQIEQTQRTLGDHVDQNPGLKRQRDLLVSSTLSILPDRLISGFESKTIPEKTGAVSLQ